MAQVIRHVVTYLGEHGEFGGPTRVALDLAAAQARGGSEVEVIAGSRRSRRTVFFEGGVRISLFPVTHLLSSRFGFASLFSLSMLRYLRESANRHSQFHVHVARDLVTLPAALVLRRAGAHYIAQTHGMIDSSDRSLAHLIDWLLTRHALRGAGYVATLTGEESEEMIRLGVEPTRVGMLANGTQLLTPTASQRYLVLFLARLHPRKGAVLFAESANLIAAKFPSIDFVIAGPDEGDRARVDSVLSSARHKNVRAVGPVPFAEVQRLMASALVYVLPAENEPFGLTIVEALAAGTPVVLSSSAQLAASVVTAGAGRAFSGGSSELAQVLDELLTDTRALEEMAVQARPLAERSFSIDSVAAKVEEIYAHAHASLDEGHPKPGSTDG